MKKVTIEATTMSEIIAHLQKLTHQLMDISNMAFEGVNKDAFYMNGKAETMVQYLYQREKRKEVEGFSIETDLYGKVQSLALYYDLMHRYTLHAVEAMKAYDEEMVALAEQLNIGY